MNVRKQNLQTGEVITLKVNASVDYWFNLRERAFNKGLVVKSSANWFETATHRFMKVGRV